MMNVLFINSISAHKYGGGEKWMITAAEGLQRKGHRVVLASKKNAVLLRKGEERGVTTSVFNIRSDFSPLQTFLVKRFIERNRIDVLICNLNKDVRVAGLAARLASNRPLVFARHGILLCGKKWKHRLTLTKLTDGIITNTRTIADAYREYGWFDESFVNVIYNGVEISADVPRGSFGAGAEGKKVIFSAGRLSTQKGFEYLIDAASQLCADRSDLFFAVAGKGRMEKLLKEAVKEKGLSDQFHFMGFVDDIAPYLKSCTVFVLASTYEGMPNAVMEAMAQGAPVVTTDVNGARELTDNGGTGIVVAPRDAKALARAIESIADSPSLQKDLSMRGQQRVKQKFTVDGMVAALEAFLLHKLQEHNSASVARKAG